VRGACVRERSLATVNVTLHEHSALPPPLVMRFVASVQVAMAARAPRRRHCLPRPAGRVWCASTAHHSSQQAGRQTGGTDTGRRRRRRTHTRQVRAEGAPPPRHASAGNAICKGRFHFTLIHTHKIHSPLAVLLAPNLKRTPGRAAAK
jgi:hypothetical protein